MKRFYTIIILISAFAAAASGCNWATDGADIIGDLDYDKGVTETSDEAEPLEITELGDTTGSRTYAIKETQEVQTDVLGDGSLMKPMTITTVFVGTLDGTKLSRKTCSIKMTEIMTKTTTYSQKTAESLDVPDIASFIDGAGKVTVANHVWLWGYHADNPLTDSVPTDKTDSRVYDQDGDQQSGITVTVMNGNGTPFGDRYMVQRVIKNYDGQKSADGEWIEGTMSFVIEGYSLGATNPQVNISPPTPQDSEKTSPFVMRRINSGADCALVISQGETLFAK